MNLMRHNTTPNGVDSLLREFFRAEMPDPWPVLKPPAEEPKRKVSWFPSAVRSRFALAASVAILLLGSWFLASNLPSGLPRLERGSGIGEKLEREKLGQPDVKAGDKTKDVSDSSTK